MKTDPRPGRIHALRKEMRQAAEHRAGLEAQLGPNLSAVQVAMIQQAEQLFLRLKIMDADFIRTGCISPADARTYGALNRDHVRLLRQFGLKAATAPVPTLAEILATPRASVPTTAPATANVTIRAARPHTAQHAPSRAVEDVAA
jgi:hypothetical protein